MASNKKDYVSKYKGEKIDELLEGIETLQGEGEGSVSKIVNDTVAEKIAEVVNDAPEDFNTLKEMSDWIAGHENSASAMNTNIATNTQNIAQLRTETDALNNTIVKKQDTIQYTTMPEPVTSLNGKIYQYIGATDSNYINGKFYKCVDVGETTHYRLKIDYDKTYYLYTENDASGPAYNDWSLTSRNGYFTRSASGYPNGYVEGTSFYSSKLVNYEITPIKQELYKWVDVSTEIDDTQSTNNTTYSSNKINNLIGLSNNLVKGYYNETDKKFYEESDYQTEVTGEVNKIYISLDTDKLYYWNSTEYKLSSGGSEGSSGGNNSSGHTIKDSEDNSMTPRDNLQFSKDFTVTDDEENNKTIIDEYELTNQDIQDIINELPDSLSKSQRGYIPCGKVEAFFLEKAPEGYLACDGSEYLISDYPKLASILLGLTNHSAYEGSDSDHFKVPDLRGEFLRGSGTNSHENQGSGSAIGEHQDGTYNWTQYHSNNGGGHYYNASGGLGLLHGNADKQLYDASYYVEIPRHSGASQSTTGRYTSRPTNTSVLFCIAYKDIFLTSTELPILYSEDNEPRIIGLYKNSEGKVKPVYRSLSKGSSISGWTGWRNNVSNVGDADIEKIFNISSINGSEYIEVNYTTGSYNVYHDSTTSIQHAGAVFEYTKTTDSWTTDPISIQQEFFNDANGESF